MKKSTFLKIYVILLSILLSSVVLADASLSLNLISPIIKENELKNITLIVNSNESINTTINLQSTSEISLAENQIQIQNNGQNNYYVSFTGINQGTYTIYANLSNNLNTLSEQSSNQVIDGTPPSITSKSPSGEVSSSDVLISVITNEAATCKYSTEDKPYDSMENQLTGESTIGHEQSLSLTSGSYVFYIRCKDTEENKMSSSEQISFSVSASPSAEIKLNKESPLSAGIVKVTVLTSKNMADVSLNYYFSEDPEDMHSIPLSGDRNLWTGFMIVPKTTVTKVGSFVFSGTDLEGKTGTKLTNGKLFIVDTTKPNSISDISAEGERYNIKLKWFYEGDVKRFNIYRSEEADVSYVDLYEDTNESFFNDRDVTPEKTYYYKVAAVSESGNIGPLTEIINAKAKKEEIYNPPENKEKNKNEETVKEENKGFGDLKISLKTLARIDKKIKKVDSLILDLEKSEKDFLANEDPIEKSAIESLRLTDDISDQKDILFSIKKQMQEYKDSFATEREINKTIEMAEIKIKKVMLTVPKKIEVLDRSTSLVDTSYEDIASAANTILNESEVKKSLSKNKQINEKAKIELNYKVAELTYLDDSKQRKTIVEKSVSYEDINPIQNIVLVEIIPKTVALSSDDIFFKTKYIKIIKKDPIIGLELEELSYEPVKLTYVLDGKKEINEIKNTKTVLISTEKSKNNVITGFAVFPESTSTFDFVVVVGVVLLIILVGYYFMIVREKPFLTKTKEMKGFFPLRQKRKETIYPNKIQNIAQARNYPENYSENIVYSTPKIKNLLSRGHYHVDNMNYESANQIYKEVLTSYNQNASIFDKNMIEVSLYSLYEKLLLISKINQMHANLMENPLQAEKDFDELNEIYKNVMRKTGSNRLTEYAQNWYDYLAGQTKRKFM